MKTHHNLYGKKLWVLPILLLLALSLSNALDVNITRVSAVVSPYIGVVPETIEDATLTPGKNFTVSIYTDYEGVIDPSYDYITGYQFALSYNPSVLNGVEVVNGDLIVGEPPELHPLFIAGPFDNVAGELSLTVGFYDEPGEVTPGPGTLANVTFTVVGRGVSDITIDSHSKLKGWNAYVPPYAYDIINAAEQPGATEPPYGSDHIQHGYFDNRFPHDVAVNTVTVPQKANNRSVVPVGVEVANLGASNETANVTVYFDSTYLDSQNVTLLVGENKNVPFNWTTTGVAQGTYTVNATVTVSGDGDPSDNWKTATILLVAHDVAVTSISVRPDSAIPGDIVYINVTVANTGASDEVANITIRYDTKYIDSQNVTLLVGENKNVPFSWNTTGVAQGTYTVNATVTVSGDGDPSDNWKTATILISVHDVAILSITAPPWVEAGQPAVFWPLTKNFGLYNETFEVKVAISNDTTVVEVQTKNITLHALAVEEALFSWNTVGVAPDSYTIKVEAILATDEDLANNNLTKSILVIVPPVASFTFSPTELVVDEVVTFNASSSYDADPGGEIVSYAWNFGDGTQKLYVDANLTDITTHTYTSAGTYTVTLTVTDKEGLNDIATTDVKVALHDITITEVTVSSNTVKIGELISINVTVRNNGSEKETFNITVHYDDIIATQSVTELASGASVLLTFSWDTSNVEAGTYTIKAVATILTGETNTADNILADGTVTIEKPPALDILPYAVAGGAAIIVIAGIAVYILKVRKPT
jgi:PKD repeat protein